MRIAAFCVPPEQQGGAERYRDGGRCKGQERHHKHSAQRHREEAHHAHGQPHNGEAGTRLWFRGLADGTESRHREDDGEAAHGTPEQKRLAIWRIRPPQHEPEDEDARGGENHRTHGPAIHGRGRRPRHGGCRFVKISYHAGLSAESDTRILAPCASHDLGGLSSPAL